MQEDNSYCILNNLGNAIFDTEDQLRHLAVSKKTKKSQVWVTIGKISVHNHVSFPHLAIYIDGEN